MLKKIGIVTALSAAFIFGGAFDTVDAQENTTYKYKVYYSINGEKGSVAGEDFNEAQTKINSIVNQVMSKYNVSWKNFNTNWEPIQKEQNVEKPVQEKEEAVQKEELKQEKEEATQKEEPKQETPVQEQPEEPVNEKPEAPVKEEPVEEQVQQPAPEKKEEAKQENELNQFEQEVVTLTNQERANYGLAPLEIDDELSRVAREKSRDMAVNNYFDHNSPVYGSPFDMMKSYGVTYQTAGENIAKGQRTPTDVVNAWMNSEGHRANILSENFTHIGVGYVEQGNHWTQQFIGK